MQNTPIADNIAVERTETATESAAEGAEIFTEVTPEMVAEGEGNAGENAFHSVSEFMEGISETQEHKSELTGGQGERSRVQYGRRGGNGGCQSIPKSELEAMGRWLINLAQQEGILEFKVLAAADIPEMKRRIQSPEIQSAPRR